MIGRAAANLAVNVTVKTKEATAGLSAFDKRLETSAVKANAAAGEYDKVNRSVEKIDASKASNQLGMFDRRLYNVSKSSSKANSQMQMFDRTLFNQAKSADVVSHSYDRMSSSSRTVSKQTQDTDTHVRKSGDGFGGFSRNVITASASLHLLGRAISLLKWPGLIAAVGYAAAAIAALSGGVVALTGALSPLVGSLASAGSALLLFGQVRAVVALTGLKNVTAAVGGLNTKLDKSTVYWKRLSPEAQKFAISLDKAKKPVLELQKAVQKPMFSSLLVGLHNVMGQMPIFEKVLTGTARRLGGVIERVSGFIGSKGFGADLAKVGRTNNQLLGKLGGVIVHLAKGFMDLVVVARPLTKWFGNLFARWAKGISTATELNRKNGDMADFFAKTKDVAQDLIAIFKNVGGALINLGKAGAPLGRMIIDKLVQGSRELKKWTESASGKNSIAKFFHDIKPPLWEAGRLLVAITQDFFKLSGRTNKLLAPLLKQLRTELLPVLTKLVAGTTKALGPRLVDLIVEVAKAMGTFAGTDGVLNTFVDTLTLLTKGLNWLLDHVPGFEQVAVAFATILGIGKALEFASWATGLKKFVGWMITLKEISIGTRIQLAAISTVEFISTKWQAGVNAVKGALTALGNTAIVTRVRLMAMAVIEKLTGAFAAVKAAVLGLSLATRTAMAATGIGLLIIGAGLIITHWDQVKKALGAVWNWIKGAAGSVAKAVGKAWDWIKNAAKNVVHAIVAAFKWLADKVVTAAKFGLLGPIPLIISRWKDVVGFLTKVWHGIVSVAKSAFGVLKSIIINPLKSAWNWIKDAFGNIGHWFADKFGDIKDGIKSALKGVAGFIGGIFSGVKNAIVSVLNWVIDKINFLIRAQNKLPFVPDIPEIPTIGGSSDAHTPDTSITSHPRGGVGARIRQGAQAGGFVTGGGTIVPIQGFQSGGVVSGGRGRAPGPKDTVPAMLQPGETVLPVGWIKKLKQSVDVVSKMMRKLADHVRDGVKRANKALSDFGDGGGKKLKALANTADDFAKQANNAISKFADKGKTDIGKIADAISGPLGKAFDQAGKGIRDWGRDGADDVDKFERSAGKSLKKTGGAIDTFAKKGGKDFGYFTDQVKGAVNKVGDGLITMKDNVNRAMKGFGAGKKVGFSIVKVGDAAAGGAAQKRQRGGRLVGGSGSGDKVPLLAEPGEVVWNREAVKAMGGEVMADLPNKIFRRFQKGGKVGGSSNAGSLGAMIALVNKYEQKSFPYSWGGGHGGFVNATQAVDCSGFVSDVLHAGGLLDGAPMVSGALMNWGQKATGNEPLVVYANPEHTLMSLNGKFAGTSTSNPGHGAGWIEGGEPSSYLSGFAKRTMDAVGGVIKSIARLMLKGPDSPTRDIGQLGLDKAREAGNAYLAKFAPSGSLGGAQPLKDLPKSLQKYNHLYQEHQSPDYSGETMPFNKIAELAEFMGTPGVTMAQVTKGESGMRPGASGVDPGGASKGWGLWAITTGVGNDSMINQLGGGPAMLNPITNAIAMQKIYEGSGLGAWYGTGFVTSSNSHYRGAMKQRGGVVGMQEGGVLGKPAGDAGGGGRHQWSRDQVLSRWEARRLAYIAGHQIPTGKGYQEIPEHFRNAANKATTWYGDMSKHQRWKFYREMRTRYLHNHGGDGGSQNVRQMLQEGGVVSPMLAAAVGAAKPTAGAGAASEDGGVFHGAGTAIPPGKGGDQTRSERELPLTKLIKRFYKGDEVDRRKVTNGVKDKLLKLVKDKHFPVDQNGDFTGRVMDLRAEADKYGEYAGYANTLGDKFHGGTETDWLTKQLRSLLSLRNALIRAEQLVTKRRKDADKVRKEAHRRAMEWDDKVKAGEKDAGRKAATPSSWNPKELDPGKDDVAKWNDLKDKKRLHLMRLFEQKHGRLPGDRKFLEDGSLATPEKFPALFPDVDSLKATQKFIAGVVEGTAKRLEPTFNDALSTIRDEITTVQGTGFPHKIVKRASVTDALFGGEIFDVQQSLKDITAAAQPEALTIDDLRSVIEAARYGVFDDLPKFHTGGVVPGPANVEVPIMARGGEVVSTGPGDVRVTNNFSWDGFGAVIETEVNGQFAKRERIERHKRRQF